MYKSSVFTCLGLLILLCFYTLCLSHIEELVPHEHSDPCDLCLSTGALAQSRSWGRSHQSLVPGWVRSEFHAVLVPIPEHRTGSLLLRSCCVSAFTRRCVALGLVCQAVSLTCLLKSATISSNCSPNWSFYQQQSLWWRMCSFLPWISTVRLRFFSKINIFNIIDIVNFFKF